MTWTLGGGTPLLGVMLLAWHVLADQSMTSSRLAASVLFVAGVGLAGGLIAVILVAQSVSDPLRGIRQAQNRVKSGETDVSVPVYDGSEVGILQAGFNDMARGLRERERLRDLFGRHVGRDVAERALASGIEMGGETRASRSCS